MSYHKLQKFALPLKPSLTDLYVNDEAANIFNSENDFYALNTGQKVTFNSFMNSFYESYWVQHTYVNDLYLKLNFQGHLQVKISRVSTKDGSEQVLVDQFLNSRENNETQYLPIPMDSHQPGRLIAQFKSHKDNSSISDLEYVTTCSPQRKVKLGVVCCTYKKENFITNTVAAINEIRGNKNAYDLQVFVIDNGRSLKPSSFTEGHCTLIPNDNFGGAGGFARGLLEITRDHSITHFLVMDDDVEVDPESLKRLINVYEHCDKNTFISGAMLDLDKPKTMFEAGAHFSQDQTGVNNILSIKSHHKNRLLSHVNEVNELTSSYSSEYGAFWFFSGQSSFLKEQGLCLPFFIRCDDIDFGLRISSNSENNILAWPGIFVWHEAFTSSPNWERYYFYRNMLATHLIHKKTNSVQASLALLKRFLRAQVRCDYARLYFMLHGLTDFLKGPDFFTHTNSQDLHQALSLKNQEFKTTPTAKGWKQLTRFNLAKAITSTLQFSFLLIKINSQWSKLRKQWHKQYDSLKSISYWEQTYQNSTPAANHTNRTRAKSPLEVTT